MKAWSLALRALFAGAATALLSGCLAATAVGTAAGVASTAVGVTAKAAGETVHVGHMAVNAATGGGDKGDAPQDGR